MYGRDDKESNEQIHTKKEQVTPFVSSGGFVFVFRALMIKKKFHFL